MLVFNKIISLQNFLHSGFVPTMGALHEGHLSLVKRSKSENDITVVSIFVNPTQFGDADDYKNYPNTPDSDLEMLRRIQCDAVFAPEVDEMYPDDENKLTDFDFGTLDKAMEGEYRQGHFNGVALVVKKLFEIVKPGNAYFGEKDFQQLMIIKKLVSMLGININIVPCPTFRENDGLAMSSRNARLNAEERKSAANLFKALSYARDNFGKLNLNEVVKNAIQIMTADPLIRVEYFSIAGEDDLLPIKEPDTSKPCRAFVAAFAGSIRLIDNMPVSG
jgi:pantoate--beta-alanine ligase